MHELSIADAVVTIASRHAAGRKVARVELRVGHLRQVVPDSLTFAFELVSAGTELEGAELVIEEVPASVRCNACAAETVLEEFPAHCAVCGALDVEVTGGDELLVEALEIEDQDGRLAGVAAGRRAREAQARATN
jgi:hydrogenase nickel incorporation protein HypA/HybF